jgi:hypothetical protein
VALAAKPHRILLEIMRAAHVTHATVTNAPRTFREQAEIMVKYYEKNGAKAARDTYSGGPGKAALDIYEREKPKLALASVIDLMTDAISAGIEAERADGGQKHLMHTSTTHYAFDVDPKTVFPAARRPQFVSSAAKHPEVSRFLHPASTPSDKVFHLEIPR